MRFQLKAIGQDGRVEALDLEAFDRSGAVQQAESRGYTVIAVRQRAAMLGGWRSGERFPVVLFSQELLVLLQAGLPLVDSIYFPRAVNNCLHRTSPASLHLDQFRNSETRRTFASELHTRHEERRSKRVCL